MRLLDTVEAWDETTIRCRTATHRDPNHPLRSRGRLSVSVGLEYAAQAMGVHVGLRDRDRQTAGRIGYVGSVRDVSFSADRLDDTLPIIKQPPGEGDQAISLRSRLESTVIKGVPPIFIAAKSCRQKPGDGGMAIGLQS